MESNSGAIKNSSGARDERRSSSHEVADAEESTRLRLLLEASISVFARFGYRKTSMEEVARAAGFSRQGVYFYYSTKEALFRGTILYVYESRLKEAGNVLADRSLSLRERLGKALDAWYGRYIGTVQAAASDLVESSGLHAAEIVKTFEERLDAMLVRALSAEKELTRAYRSVKVHPAQIARVLHATAQGLKDTCQRREDFIDGMNAAAALICAYPSA